MDCFLFDDCVDVVCMYHLRHALGPCIDLGPTEHNNHKNITMEGQKKGARKGTAPVRPWPRLGCSAPLCLLSAALADANAPLSCSIACEMLPAIVAAYPKCQGRMSGGLKATVKRKLQSDLFSAHRARESAHCQQASKGRLRWGSLRRTCINQRNRQTVQLYSLPARRKLRTQHAKATACVTPVPKPSAAGQAPKAASSVTPDPQGQLPTGSAHSSHSRSCSIPGAT